MVQNDLRPDDRFQNPFAINRAEHLGEDLYRYFAGAQLLGGLLSRRSLVLQGGRGSGKTMFFMYHSYESKKREHYDGTANRSRILERERYLGIYFKAEPDVVTGFHKKGLDEERWLNIFGHYFNCFVCRAMCQVAADLIHCELVDFPDEAAICSTVARNFGWLEEAANTFQKLAAKLDGARDEILLYINNIDKISEPLLSHHSNAMRLMAQHLAASMNIPGIAFHVFVDEFENLLAYQQCLLNSLIKNPRQHLVFDIGMKKHGFKTLSTLAADEHISASNDFTLFDLEQGLGDSEFNLLMKEICNKRLRTVPELAKCGEDDPRLRIDRYLGTYDPKREVALITAGKRKPPYLRQIKALLAKTRDIPEREALFEALTADPDPVVNRLNLVLLVQRKSPDTIIQELERFRRGEPSKYRDWLHNYGLGVVFLLCHDYRQRKRYFGYDAFMQLSSGIARYFIQLCFYAFDYAHRDEGFTFADGKELPIDVQDRAAHYLSGNKVDEIDTYVPVGHKLKRLTLVLGRILEQLHKKPSIGEPERTHFYTDYDRLSDSAKEVMRSGIMWAVFQARPLTKIKSAEQPREKEYHLNHIYAPYFEISYRRKRRLDIRAEDFNNLVDGDDEAVAKVAKKLIGRGAKVAAVWDLLRWQDMRDYQLDLWTTDDAEQDL